MSCTAYLYKPVSDTSVSESKRTYKVLFAVIATECEHADNVLGLISTGGIPIDGGGVLPPFGSTYARLKETVGQGCPERDFNNNCGPDGVTDPTLAYCDAYVRVMNYRVREPSADECRTMRTRGFKCCEDHDVPDADGKGPCNLWMVEGTWQTVDWPLGSDLDPEPVGEAYPWCPEVSKSTTSAMQEREEELIFEGLGYLATNPTDCNQCGETFTGAGLVAVDNPCLTLAIGDCRIPTNSAGKIFTDIQSQIIRNDIELSYSDFIASYDDSDGSQSCFPMMTNEDDILITLDCRNFIQKIPANKGLLISFGMAPETRVIDGQEVRYVRRSFVWRINERGWCINSPNRGKDRCAGSGAPDGGGGTLDANPTAGNSPWEEITSELGKATQDSFLDVNGQPEDLSNKAAVGIMRWCPKAYNFNDLLSNIGGSGFNSDGVTPYIQATAPTP